MELYALAGSGANASTGLYPWLIGAAVPTGIALVVLPAYLSWHRASFLAKLGGSQAGNPPPLAVPLVHAQPAAALPRSGTATWGPGVGPPVDRDFEAEAGVGGGQGRGAYSQAGSDGDRASALGAPMPPPQSPAPYENGRGGAVLPQGGFPLAPVVGRPDRVVAGAGPQPLQVQPPKLVSRRR